MSAQPSSAWPGRVGLSRHENNVTLMAQKPIDASWTGNVPEKINLVSALKY